MGNLSCVSCKTRESKAKKSAATVPTCRPDTGRPEATADDVIRDVSSDVSHTELLGTAEACDAVCGSPDNSCSILPRLHATDAENKESTDKQVYDIEIIAGAIVQMTLFIASKVMCPAIERYLHQQEISSNNNNNNSIDNGL